MHGLSPHDEIKYWRDRFEAAQEECERLAAERNMSYLVRTLECERLQHELNNERQVSADVAALVCKRCGSCIHDCTTPRAISDNQDDAAEQIATWLEAACPCGYTDCESRARLLAEAIRRGDWRTKERGE